MQVEPDLNQNTPDPNPRTPTHSEGYTMIPPNESKRSEMQRMAQTEEDNWQKYKEEHKPGPINLAPERLGGNLEMSKARERQQMEANQSKLQKKLKKEDMDKKKREAEEEENQMMKAIQREKSERQEMRRKEEEERRNNPSLQELRMKRVEHLQKQQQSTSVPMPASSSTPASSGGEHLEGKRLEMEDRKRPMETKHQRANSFLDRLEANGSGRTSDLHPYSLESGNVWQREEPQDPASSHVTFPSQPHADSAMEMEGADSEWIVMKLMSDFPYYEREMLEDIVSQCNNNFQKAYDLLHY
ncbi:epithelial-stromal interaction protein 1 isoform X2 [Trichomycterus rosablanca]